VRQASSAAAHRNNGYPQHTRPVIPMGLTPEHALVPPLRPLPDDMARELFGDVVGFRGVALGLAASPRCFAIGLAFPRATAAGAPAAAGAARGGHASSSAPASPRSAESPQQTTLATVAALPEYAGWGQNGGEDDEEEDDDAEEGGLRGPVLQVLYSQFPYMHPDPAARMIWPWSATEGAGWRNMSAAFRAWLAVHAAHVFRATGCCELHLWIDARPTWKVVIPENPALPARIEA
jgi:hypothetical protein